jgi:ribosomal protein L29
MAIIKAKDAKKMTNLERNEKIKELKVELIKARLSNKKTTKLNAKEIKRTIARLLTFNNANKEKVEPKAIIKKEENKVRGAKK